MLARNPALGPAFASLYAGTRGDEPTLPWIAEQPSIPIGKDEQGAAQYVVGLGLPIEVLNQIPTLNGRDLERTIGGMAHPLIKTGYGIITGNDPYFGSKFMSYDKAPASWQALGADQNSEAARWYHMLAGTGLIQPWETAQTTFDRFLDQRTSAGDKAAGLLAGLKIASNDPNRATIKILQEELQRNPSARTYQTFAGGSPEVDDLIQQLSDARRRAKEAREAAAGVMAP
jgi:hypothetical protein